MKLKCNWNVFSQGLELIMFDFHTFCTLLLFTQFFKEQKIVSVMDFYSPAIKTINYSGVQYDIFLQWTHN